MKSWCVAVVCAVGVAFSAVGAGDVLQQLHVSPAKAGEEVVWSLSTGVVAFEPMRDAFKSASPAARVALVEQSLGWIRSYTASADFEKAYAKLRNEQKPEAPDAGADADARQAYAEQLKEFNEQYPATAKALLIQRIGEFLSESAGVAWDAKLVRRGGRMVFADERYEGMSGEWKLCYRAGREPVQKARAIATTWLAELKGH